MVSDFVICSGLSILLGYFMSTYTKTKFLAKSLVLLSLLAVIISGGAFLVGKNEIGADTSTITSSSDSNNILKITVTPNSASIGTSVAAKIEATNPTDPTKQIKKIVLWACLGTGPAVLASNSSTCVTDSGQPAVKASFSLADGTLKFDKNNKATMSATWKTSGSIAGDHALMVKAHSTESGGINEGYIEESKAAVTVSLNKTSTSNDDGSTDSTSTDSTSTGSNSTGSTNTADFDNRASDTSTGSKISTIQELADRILTWVLSFIGILAFFALVYGGFAYMGAGGDSEKASKAKKVILYAILGLVLAFLAYAITRIFVQDVLSIFPQKQ